MPLNYSEADLMDEKEFADFLAHVKKAATTVLFSVSESLSSLSGQAVQAIIAALA